MEEVGLRGNNLREPFRESFSEREDSQIDKEV
jgi:hypothetical protein